jgi:hypothetical protein
MPEASATDQDPAIRDLAAFLAHLAHERRLSPLTLSNYRRDLERIGAWRAGAGPGLDWAAMTPEEVRRYVAWRHRGGAGGKTLQRELSALRSLFKYLLREGRLGANPAQGIRAPKTERKLPTTFEADHLCALLDQAQSEDPLALRDRAMIELFYSSGLRLAELVSINLNDIDLEDASLEVLGKGAKSRRVPVGVPRPSRPCGAGIRYAGNSPAPGKRPSSSASAVTASTPAPSSSASSTGRWYRAPAATCTPTCCATPSPATCWNPPATCAPSRNSSAMPISAPPRSTPTWIFSTWPRSMTRLTPGRGARARKPRISPARATRPGPGYRRLGGPRHPIISGSLPPRGGGLGRGG